ncbi:MAG: hypothetical protein QXY99_08250, partial [Thermoproteota archaeon]
MTGQLALGVLILVILIQQANVEDTFKTLLKADAKYVLFGSLLIVAASTMIALSFYSILSTLRYKVGLS